MLFYRLYLPIEASPTLRVSVGAVRETAHRRCSRMKQTVYGLSWPIDTCTKPPIVYIFRKFFSIDLPMFKIRAIPWAAPSPSTSSPLARPGCRSRVRRRGRGARWSGHRREVGGGGVAASEIAGGRDGGRDGRVSISGYRGTGAPMVAGIRRVGRGRN
jgi:hypothetical protein